MISAIIRFSAKNPWLVLFLTVGLMVLTVFGSRRIALDALPDLSDAQVIVFAEWSGRSPDLIEDQVTYPLVTSLLSTPKVRYVRGLSMGGASQVLVVFEDKTDLYWARSRVAEKLASVSGLPSGVIPNLGPEATGLGWVFQYALVDKSGGLDLRELRTLQDWNLRFALQAVPGVAEVASFGGYVKQYQVLLDPLRLQALGVSPLQVVRAIRAGNQEVGAHVLEMGGTEYMIRGRGYIKSLSDIRKIPIIVSGKGRAITVGDVARVQIGPQSRDGAGELDGEGEAVGGIVVMRVGANALKVITNVKKRLESLKASLPKGVEMVTVYDRSELIVRALDTLKKVLVEEIFVVALLVSLFLWHARASWVAILPLPIAVLLSFLPMILSEFTVNIMSLGGIALAIGAMVDSGIILVENAHKKLEGYHTKDMSESQRRTLITDSMVEMGKPLFFSLMVITVSFLPIFALEGREGRLFKPLAFTKTVSMAWASLLAVTLTPALAILLLKGKFVPENKHAVSRWMHQFYGPTVDFVVHHRWSVVAAAAFMMLFTIPIYRKIPSEFMPPLNEGSILYMPTSVAGMSLDTAIQIMQKQNTLIKSLPEVEHVMGKAGRATSATDPAPINMFETIIRLKPESEWRKGFTYEKIVAELDSKLQFPGQPNIWWMPIQTRIEMLSTGIRSAVGVKVLGPNLKDVDKAAVMIETALKKMPTTRSAFAERAQVGSFIDIDVKREAAAIYGLNIADVHSILETAVGGSIASTLVDGRERYSIQVRYAPDFRSNLKTLGEVLIPTSSGAHVQLKEVASITVSTGAPMVSSENGKILGFVFVDVARDQGLSEYVAAAKKVLADQVTLPEGVYVEFSGQFESLKSAKETLVLVIPMTLFVIALLIYLNTKSFWETLIVLLAVPFSLLGAFWLMWVLDYKMSVAAWVGILALAGLDAETGVVMLLYLTRAYQSRLDQGDKPSWEMLKASIHEGAVQRVRPKLMTVAAALIGLLPVMWSQGTGSEVMKRIAAPMVGGIVTSGLLELLVYPAIFCIWKCVANQIPSPLNHQSSLKT